MIKIIFSLYEKRRKNQYAVDCFLSQCLTQSPEILPTLSSILYNYLD